MTVASDIIGQGIRFPLQVGPDGGIAASSGETALQESIWLILGTARGERQMEPRFGCGMHDAVFEPNSPGTHAAIAHQVHGALTEWEPRIDVLDVRVDAPAEEENVLLVRVDYRVRSTNALGNLVYPLYIREGVA
jgi:phage baseplate assembly protein W